MFMWSKTVNNMQCARNYNNANQLAESSIKENLRWKAEKSTCNVSLQNPLTNDADTTMYCKPFFDNITCWSWTEAGSVAEKPCPDYFFKSNSNATRHCLANAQWYNWTNYSSCHMQQEETGENYLEVLLYLLRPIQIISIFGYILSLVTLLTATFIMLYFVKLRSDDKNKIHVNLFISFIFRASICLTKDALYASDVAHKFCGDSPHWQCRLFFTLYNYFIATNNFCVLMEGFYLHTLLFFAPLIKPKVKYFIIFGWLFPLTFVIPWAIVRLTLDNKECWSVHTIRPYFLIIQAPLTASVIVNFCLLLRILHLLYEKVKESGDHLPEQSRLVTHWRLVKAALVLIPLFGVHSMLFIALPTDYMGNPHAEAAKLGFELIFNSLQGFMVAVLFCFLNTEVRKVLSDARGECCYRISCLISHRRRVGNNAGSNLIPRASGTGVQTRNSTDNTDLSYRKKSSHQYGDVISKWKKSINEHRNSNEQRKSESEQICHEVQLKVFHTYLPKASISGVRVGDSDINHSSVELDSDVSSPCTYLLSTDTKTTPTVVRNMPIT